MSNFEQLAGRFLAGPDALGEDDYAALVQALENSPELAARLCEQLVVDELLAQKLDPERQHFSAQVEQRLADIERGEEDFEVQIEAMRDLAVAQLRRPDTPDRSATWHVPAIAFGLLLAAGVCGYFLWPSPIPIARVGEIEGGGMLLRSGIRTALTPGAELRPGDLLTTAAPGQVLVNYPDGTWLRVFDESRLRLARDSKSAGKRVHLDHGRLASSITPQPAGAPMLFISPTATAKVVGTELWLAVDKQSTALQVTEGKVEFWRANASQVVVVDPGKIGLATTTGLEVKLPLWPVERRSLAFACASNAEPAVMRNAKSGVLHSTRLVSRGEASHNARGGMKLAGGSFQPEDGGIDHQLLDACRETNELTVEAVLRPDHLEQNGPTNVVAYSQAGDAPAFSLTQQGDSLIWRLQTDAQGDREFSICKLLARKTVHCLVSYRAGVLACYIDGAKVFEDTMLTSGFANWKEPRLALGAKPSGSDAWHGTLEGVAVYNRFFSAEDAQRSAEGFQNEYLQSAEDENWKDLLSQVDPARHAVAGRWFREAGDLRSDKADGARLVFPVVPDGNYRLQVELSRTTGLEPFRLLFPVGQTQALLVLDGELPAGKRHSGLERIDGQPSHENLVTLERESLDEGKRHQVEVSVISLGPKSHVRVFLDEQPLLEWSGKTNALSADPKFQLPDVRFPALISEHGELRFHAARLKMETGSIRD